MSKVLDLANKRLDEEVKQQELGANNQGDINYWCAYRDGANAMVKEVNANMGTVATSVIAPDEEGIKRLKAEHDKYRQILSDERREWNKPSYDGAFLAEAEFKEWKSRMFLERGWFLQAVQKVGVSDPELLFRTYVGLRDEQYKKPLSNEGVWD